jgi:hypothetical protein
MSPLTSSECPLQVVRFDHPLAQSKYGTSPLHGGSAGQGLCANIAAPETLEQFQTDSSIF